MDDYLRLAIGHMDGDGTAELHAAVQCKGFCGNSSAWFGISQLEESSDLLLAYPLPTDGYPLLDGPRRTGDGYYKSVILDPDGNRIEITA